MVDAGVDAVGRMGHDCNCPRAAASSAAAPIDETAHASLNAEVSWVSLPPGAAPGRHGGGRVGS